MNEANQHWLVGYMLGDYDRPLQIKPKVDDDPLSTSYAAINTSSETWSVGDDGRMCTA